MRGLSRDKRTIFYCTHNKTDYTDEGVLVEFNQPVEIEANVSSSKGISSTELFGNYQDYDKTIIIHNADCPIDENTALFVDKPPEFDVDGYPLFDYEVKRVAKSQNISAYAVKKVR